MALRLETQISFVDGMYLKRANLLRHPRLVIGVSRTVEASAKHAELQSYKAEVRAKTIAVGKAEIILNDVCLSMARRVGRAEGVQVSESKGGILLEVCVGAPTHSSTKGCTN